MIQNLYFISCNGAHIGPFSQQEILVRLLTEQTSWMDYIFDEPSQEWIMLMEHEKFTEAFNAGHGRPPGSHLPGQNEQMKEKTWFLLREGKNFGPFSTLEILRMLQEKSAFEFDHIWQAGQSAWKRISQVAAFRPEQIKKYHLEYGQKSEHIFLRRKYERHPYTCSLIIHNNKAVSDGESLELSEGGAGLQVANPSLQPGQNLYLHFKPGQGVPAFNVVSVIVSKHLEQEFIKPHETVKYNVKFTSLSQKVRESIRGLSALKQKAS